jgi:hypothetical protein
MPNHPKNLLYAQAVRKRRAAEKHTAEAKRLLREAAETEAKWHAHRAETLAAQTGEKVSA